MARILITGMSGTGKSTVLGELSRRGYRTLDTDYDGWVLPDGDWDEPRMERFLREQPTVFVSGTVANQGRFYHRFEQVVLLSAPADVLRRRIVARSTHSYGKSAQDWAEVEENLRTVEPLLRRGATLELDARVPVSELADALERLGGRTRV